MGIGLGEQLPYAGENPDSAVIRGAANLSEYIPESL
jgi:hypothetical protein